MKARNIVFIIGPHKTGTSTLVGILNQHPDIFILYETFLFRSIPSKYGIRFLKKYPKARYLFRSYANITELYIKLNNFLKKKGFNFQIIGDKYPTIDTKILKFFEDQKIIFTIRDIETWLCKNKILSIYKHYRDIIPVALDYSIFFLKSFLLKDVLHIRLEDLIYENEKVIRDIGEFLKIDLFNYAKNYWVNFDVFCNQEPKKIQGWEKSHQSSKIPPQKEDTIVKLNKEFEFWEQLLPIFKKYYNNINKKFKKIEVEEDILKIEDLIKYSPINIRNAYEEYTSITFKQQSIKNFLGHTILKILRNIERPIRKFLL